MKHNNFLSSLVHFVANGALPTPPCNSHGFFRVFADGEPTANRRSTDGRPTVEYAVQHTLRYASLILTFLLMVSTNAWGWVLAGEGLPGMNSAGQGWNIFKSMQDQGNGVYGITFSNVEANSSIKYRVKVLPNDNDWTNALDKNKLDNSRSNVEFVDGNETQIAFNTYAKMDICIYTDGSKVWVLQHYPGSGASPTTIALRGDMWLSDAGGWRENDLPTFTKSTDNKSASLTVVLPVSQTRVALVIGGSTKNPGDGWEFKTGYKFYNNQTSWNNSSISNEKVIFAPLTRTIAATFTYSNQKVYVAYSDYIVKKQGWHVFIDGNDKGVTNADGELVISGLSYSNGGTAHTIYVTDGSTTNCWFGVNKFGGLYINKSKSDVNWGTQYVYKTNTSQKFSDASWPIVGNYDQTGRFKLNEDKAVKVTFDGGEITINKVAAPAPDLDNDYYVFGAGGTDWVDGWSTAKWNDDYKLNTSGNVASKTFYNVKGDCLFKIWKKSNDSQLKFNAVDNSKGNITLTLDGTENIKIPLGNVRHDVTVYTDGSKVWVNAYAHSSMNDGKNYSLEGDYNGWHNWSDNQYKLTNIDDYTRQITYRFDPNASYCNGKKIIRLKVVPATDDWGNCADLRNVDEASSQYTKAAQSEDWGDNAGNDNRILVKLSTISDVTITLWKDGSGNKKVTIKVVESTEPEPDPSLQPWSGDSYKEWWLTGDFTCTQKNHFDGWANPTDKKFTLSQDGLHQTVTIQLDPATDDETKIHNENGHKLTRFEITKGDWYSDRINKPQFDSDGSNCSLQTDWKEPGSNRMTFELTQKSDITFDIWRLGTSASNAERKVTVTITPIEQFTVAFNDGNTQLSSQQVYSGEHPTNPTDPKKDGYKFLGWSETDGGDVVDVTTITITAAKTFYAKWIQQFEVTFNTDGGSAAPEKQTIDKDSKVTQPADPTKNERIFVAWQKNGVDYDFNAGVTESFELKATWKEYPLTDVSLSESEVELKKNEQVTLTATHNPTYAGIQTAQWSSDHPETASVVDGVVTAIAIGTATITYSATDKDGNTKKATCAVTVSSGKPKPTFTWVMDGADFNTTVYPGAMYQISVEANSILPTLAISGVGTLSNEVVSGNKVSYTLSIPANATGSFTLTASTTETTDYDVAANVQNMTVATCSREDVKMYEFVMDTREAQSGKSVDGGTVSYDAMFDNTGIPTKCDQFTVLFVKEGSYTSNDPYGIDDNESNMMQGSDAPSNDNNVWYRIPCGKNSSNSQLYYIKNKATGRYLYRGTVSGGGDWYYAPAMLSDTKSDNDNYKWAFANDNNSRMNIINANGYTNQTGDNLKGTYHLHTNNWLEPNSYSNCKPKAIICGTSCDMGRNCVRPKTVTITDNVDNPDYVEGSYTVGGKTYYRFANNTSKIITALGNSETLKAGDKVTLYIYNAGAKASAANIQLLADDQVAYTFTNEVAASATPELTYTIPAGSTLIGKNVSVRPSNTDICFSTIKLMRPVDPSTFPTPTFTWSEDVTNLQKVYEQGAFNITATPSIVSDVTYSSSNEGIATVAADGTVTPKAVGTVTITASTAQTDCFNAGQASYEVEIITNLTIPTFTFTVPEAIYQGSKHAISVTSNSDQAISLELMNGSTGVTLKDVVAGVGSATATLEFAGNATSATLRATTAASTTCAAGVQEQLYAVVGCYPDGRDLYSFTMTNEIDATNTPADGGTISYSNLNATVSTIKVKFYNESGHALNGQKPFMADDGSGYVVGTLEANDGSDLWYPIATGETFKSYNLFYLKNVKTGNYIRRGTDASKKDGSWGNYNAEVVAQQQTSDEFKWFFDTSKGTHLGCYAGAYGDNHDSEFKNTYCIQTDNWLRPNDGEYANCKPTKLVCGRPGDPDRAWTKVDTKTEGSALDPDNIVTLNLNEVLKEDDKISIKVHNSSSSALGATSKVRIYTAAGALVKEFDAALSGSQANVTYEYSLGSSDALAGATSVVIRHTDLNLHFDNFKVFRPQEGEFIEPELTWDNIEAGATVALNKKMTSTMTHVATTNTPQVLSPITYSSSDENVATVDANTGIVTATLASGVETVTITATQAGIGCYKEAKVSYTIQVYNTNLQELVDAAEETLTLPCDFTDNVTIEKKLTINANGNKIGNLTITNTGDLTLASAMTANNLYISADQAGHVSGQLKGADNLNLEGTAYMDLSFAAPNAVTEGWYAFTVPFTVSSTQGIYNVEDGVATKLNNETQYAIMQYQGNVRAQGNYGWIKTHKVGGMLQPGTLYIISFGDTDYDKIRFVKASGNLKTKTVNVYEYASGVTTDAGWNGVGNPTLAYGNASETGGAEHAQFLNHEDNAFIASEEAITNQTYIVSSAFFIQAYSDATMTFNIPAENGNLYAPRRGAAEGNSEFMVEISQAGKTHDRIFLSASDEASATYEIGHDLIKMGAVSGSAKVAQMAINGYGMSLCDAEFMFDANNEAVFPLTLTAPKAGTYTLAVKRANEGQTITLLQNGLPIVMTDGQVSIDLAKGTTTEYSLVIGRTKTDVVTGNEQLKAKGEGVQKFILHNQLRIRKANKIFNAQGIEL